MRNDEWNANGFKNPLWAWDQLNSLIGDDFNLHGQVFVSQVWWIDFDFINKPQVIYFNSWITNWLLIKHKNSPLYYKIVSCNHFIGTKVWCLINKSFYFHWKCQCFFSTGLAEGECGTTFILSSKLVWHLVPLFTDLQKKWCGTGP